MRFISPAFKASRTREGCLIASGRQAAPRELNGRGAAPEPPSVALRAPEGLHVSSSPPRDLCNHPHGESAASDPIPHGPLPRRAARDPPRVVSTDNPTGPANSRACTYRQLRGDIIDAVSKCVRVRILAECCRCVM